MRTVELPKQGFGAPLSSNSSTPLDEPGIVRWLHDPAAINMQTGAVVPIGYGPCAFKYVRTTAALAFKSLASKPAVTAVDNITSGTTRSATTSGLTANAFVRMLVHVYDCNAGAAAPEQETVQIVSNTTTVVQFDSDTPLSAALAANDDLRVIPWCYAEAAAAGDTAEEVQGIVVGDVFAGTPQIDSGNWGWVQCYGISRAANTANTAVVENTSGKAGTANITVTSSGGGDTLGLAIGHFMCSSQGSLSADSVPFFIDVLHPGGRAPLGA